MPRTVSALALCAVAVACSGDSTEPEVRDPIEGEYALQSINGRPLPVTLLEFLGFYRLQQISGTMTLNVNRTFVESASLRETIFTETGSDISDTTVVLNGVWEVEQDSAILLTTAQDGSVLFGVVRNGRLTLHFEPQSVDSLFTYVYQK